MRALQPYFRVKRRTGMPVFDGTRAAMPTDAMPLTAAVPAPLVLPSLPVLPPPPAPPLVPAPAWRAGSETGMGMGGSPGGRGFVPLPPLEAGMLPPHMAAAIAQAANRPPPPQPGVPRLGLPFGLLLIVMAVAAVVAAGASVYTAIKTGNAAPAAATADSGSAADILDGLTRLRALAVNIDANLAAARATLDAVRAYQVADTTPQQLRAAVAMMEGLNGSTVATVAASTAMMTASTRMAAAIGAPGDGQGAGTLFGALAPLAGVGNATNATEDSLFGRLAALQALVGDPFDDGTGMTLLGRAAALLTLASATYEQGTGTRTAMFDLVGDATMSGSIIGRLQTLAVLIGYPIDTKTMPTIFGRLRDGFYP